MDNLCTICSDLINSENTYTTKCGHLFHFDCLSQWLSSKNSCPLCRTQITTECFFPTVSNEATGDNVTTLQLRLQIIELHMQLLDVRIKILKAIKEFIYKRETQDIKDSVLLRSTQ